MRKKDLIITYNWYWLLDLLQEAGYTVHLANPLAIQQYSGLKHIDDRHDAFWLAEMLRLNILPVVHKNLPEQHIIFMRDGVIFQSERIFE